MKMGGLSEELAMWGSSLIVSSDVLDIFNEGNHSPSFPHENMHVLFPP